MKKHSVYGLFVRGIVQWFPHTKGQRCEALMLTRANCMHCNADNDPRWYDPPEYNFVYCYLWRGQFPGQWSKVSCITCIGYNHLHNTVGYVFYECTIWNISQCPLPGKYWGHGNPFCERFFSTAVMVYAKLINSNFNYCKSFLSMEFERSIHACLLNCDNMWTNFWLPLLWSVWGALPLVPLLA